MSQVSQRAGQSKRGPDKTIQTLMLPIHWEEQAIEAFLRGTHIPGFDRGSDFGWKKGVDFKKKLQFLQ